jgi:hypothetical protein
MLYIFILLIFISSSLFWVSMVSPKHGLFWLNSSRTRLKAGLIYVGVNIVGVMGIGFVFMTTALSKKQVAVDMPASMTDTESTSSSVPPSEVDSQSSEPIAENDRVAAIEYAVIGRDHLPGIENYSLVVPTHNLSEFELKKFALRAKSELCHGDCNVSLFDEKQAYLLNKRMDAEVKQNDIRLASQELSLDEYKSENERVYRKYYVKVADHFLGWLDFSSGEFFYYPFQDDRYTELGGANRR